MTKREFLRLLGMGIGAAFARPATGWADRIRILGEGRDPEWGVTPREVRREFQEFFSHVWVGEARAHGALRVFWLHGKSTASPFPVATLEEARSRGDLVVRERDEATVPTLVVENRGKIPVVLLAGEILLGGKQNRVIAEDVLLPPLSGPRSIPVYCVEQGRWTGRTTNFEAKGTFAAPGLRARLMERAEQRRVWAEVDQYAGRAAAASPTGNYQAIYDAPEVQAHQKEVEQAFVSRVAPGANGAAVFAGESLTGLDLFEDTGLFAREWPKLLHAHAIETYGRPPHLRGEEERMRSWLEGLLRRSATVKGTLRRSAGAGELFEFQVDQFRGSALVAKGQVVHAALV